MGDLSQHFSSSEFTCGCGCGFDCPRPELIEALETLRRFIADKHGERPIKILSGCRCSLHNKAVEGARHSRHLYRDAADIAVPGLTPGQVMELAQRVGPIKSTSGGVPDGFGGLGIGHSKIHVDARPRKADGTRALWTYGDRKYRWAKE